MTGRNQHQPTSSSLSLSLYVSFSLCRLHQPTPSQLSPSSSVSTPEADADESFEKRRACRKATALSCLTAVRISTNNVKDNQIKRLCRLSPPASDDLWGWSWEQRHSLIDGVVKINSLLWQAEDQHWMSLTPEFAFLLFSQCNAVLRHLLLLWETVTDYFKYFAPVKSVTSSAY